MITVLRPLSASELLDRTFHLYRNHFVMFAGITAISGRFHGGDVVELRQADATIFRV